MEAWIKKFKDKEGSLSISSRLSGQKHVLYL